ncbi:MAG: T9SS type A sorting domain-containing protein [Chitinophagaceae bacterium]|nr:T9SS type A sorting domain-containing protein [Chitinophagaceae bacterium]
MKKFFTLIACVTFFSCVVMAQFTQDFEGSYSSLTGNCWDFLNVEKTTEADEVITGTGSLYSNPPTSGSSTRDITSPVLNVQSSLTISFNYKMGSNLNSNATRSITVGLLRPNGTMITLQTIQLNQASGTTVYNFNETFAIATPGLYRLAILMGGSTGNGNSRLIFDDLYVSSSPQYGPVSNCNSAPVAVNDSFTGFPGEVIVGNLVLNDSEPNGEAITPSIITPSPDGTVIMNTDGSFSFTPYVGFTGTSTTFTYRLSDAGFPVAYSNVATVTITISIPIILPVTLHSFEVVYHNPNVDLNWVSEEEINFSHYEIERSIDGDHYNKLAVILGSAGSASEKNYNYSDKETKHLKGTIYYRLIAVDRNGKMTHSTVRTVWIGQITNLVISTYPNPVVNSVKIILPAEWTSRNVNIDVYNQAGQKIKNINQVSQSQYVEMSLAELANGIYIIKAVSGNETAVQKILKN